MHAWTVHPAPRSSRLRRLTLAADLVRVAILCSAAIWLVAGDGSAALRALLVLPAAFLGRLGEVHPAFDLLFSLALALEATATGLGAFDSISWGDSLSHLVLPLLSGPILYAGLVRVGVPADPGAVPMTHVRLGAAVVTAATVLTLGALWELVELVADSTFATDYSQGYHDTLGDLSADAIGAIGSSAFVAATIRPTGELGWPPT